MDKWILVVSMVGVALIVGIDIGKATVECQSTTIIKPALKRT